MTSEVGSGQVAIFPVFKGFRKAVEGITDSSAKSAGKGFQTTLGKSGLAAGRAAGQGFQSGFKSTGGVKALNAAVTSAGKAVSSARLKEQDAIGKVRVAEAALTAARKNGIEGSARVVAAEEKLSSAQRAAAAAQNVTRESSNRLATAQKQAADVTVQSNQRSAASVRGFLSSSFRRGANIGIVAGGQVGSGFLGAFKRAILPLAAVTAGAIGVRAIVGGFKTAIKNASDLQQSIGGVEAVFGKSAKQVKAFASVAASAVGLTKNQYSTVAAILGSQLKNGGTAVDKIAGKTQKLIGLGADLSATFGGSAADAVDALSSALKGERDPIERYGVSLTQAKINAEAAALGFKQVGGQLTSQATQAATLSLVYKQTTAAQGQFAAQTNTLGEQQQILHANLTNLSAGFGTIFLPVITKIVGVLNTSVLPAFQKASPAIQKFFGGFTDRLSKGVDSISGKIGAISGLVDRLSSSSKGLTFAGFTSGLKSILPQLAPFLGILQILGPTVQKLLAAVGPQLTSTLAKLAPSFVDLLKSILPLLPPLTDLIVSIVPSLVTLLKLLIPLITDFGRNVTIPLFKQISKFFDVLQAMITFIGDPSTAGLAQFNKSLGKIGGVFAFLIGITNNFSKLIGGYLGGLIQNFRSFQAGATRAVAGVISFFSGLPGAIGDAVSGAGKWLIGTGQQIIAGLLKGVTNAAKGIGSFFANIGKDALNGIKGALGIHSPSTVFEHEVGEQIPAGVAKGIRGKTAAVMAAVKSMFDPAGVLTATFGAASPDTTSQSSGSTRPIYLDGTLIGWLREFVNGEATFILNAYDSAARATGVGRKI